MLCDRPGTESQSAGRTAHARRVGPVDDAGYQRQQRADVTSLPCHQTKTIHDADIT